MPNGAEHFSAGFAVTLTAEPIFGQALTLAECSRALSRMSFGSVVGRLVLLKHINEGVICDGDTPENTRRMHILRTLAFLLDRPGVIRALADAGSDPLFRPLSDQALLATLELAVRYCPRDNTNWINDDPLRLELTHVLLSFQSVLFSSRFRQRLDGEQSLEDLGDEALAEFLRNTLAHRTDLYPRNALGRLYALCCIPAVMDAVLARTGKSATEWFLETFELTPTEYLGCAFLSSAPSMRLDFNAPDAEALFYREETFWNAVDESHRSKIKRLLGLATQQVGPPSGTSIGSLDEFLFEARSFYVRPVLDFGHVSICVSPNLMMSKFIVGLPYLAQESRQRVLNRPLTSSERKACRAPFGILLESFVAWLVARLLAQNPEIEVLPNITYGPTAQRAESDLIVVRGDLAVVIEVKTTMTSLEFRRTGAFESLDMLLESGAKQAYRAALALREGRAYRSDGSCIEGVRWVVPCVLTYDDIPLFAPISDFYEQHLMRKTGLPLFQAAGGVEAVQFFDIGFLESWEEHFDFSPGSGALFGYLVQRARRLDLRYRGFRAGISAAPAPGAPLPFNEVVEESQRVLNSVRTWLTPTGQGPGAPCA